jgi:hypothetical protein
LNVNSAHSAGILNVKSRCSTNEASPQTDEYQRQHRLNGLARIGMKHILDVGGYNHADDTGTAARPCVAGY